MVETCVVFDPVGKYELLVLFHGLVILVTIGRRLVLFHIVSTSMETGGLKNYFSSKQGCIILDATGTRTLNLQRETEAQTNGHNIIFLMFFLNHIFSYEKPTKSDKDFKCL